MTILVTGSMAIDRIMVFQDHFRNHILPDKLHMLNVAFHVPTLRQFFGGTAGNIAYNLRLLGEDPLILAPVGSDFAAYGDWLDRNGIRRDGLVVFEDQYTAQAFITTDLDDNQIIAFHPGAMDCAADVSLDDVGDALRWGVVSSNDKRAMQEYAAGLKARGVSTLIDPSHQLPVFGADELRDLVEGATLYIANDYEWALTQEQTGESESQLAARVETVVVTGGSEGSRIRQGDREIEIPPAKAERVVDPTGCGDAYRAGLLYGLSRDLPFEVAGRIGSVMGALTVEQDGPQSVRTDLEQVRERYRREFGVSF